MSFSGLAKDTYTKDSSDFGGKKVFCESVWVCVCVFFQQMKSWRAGFWLPADLWEGIK